MAGTLSENELRRNELALAADKLALVKMKEKNIPWWKRIRKRNRLDGLSDDEIGTKLARGEIGNAPPPENP